MHSNQDKDQSREGTGFPIEGKIALSVIVAGLLALVLKAVGVF